MEFNKELELKVEEVERIVKEYLPEEVGYQKRVLEAMNYSVLAGGKRLRPMLMQETYRFFANKKNDDNKEKNIENIDALHRFMAALEYIHTYSLVHDDLPAMDNDVLRRGLPTTHVKYGHAMAILAGDGLLNYAFEVASSAFNKDNNTEKVIEALKVLAHKPGIYGMLGGQVIDVENTGKEIELETLQCIHRLKTSALIETSMMIGAIFAGASKDEVNSVSEVAVDIGLAFQIQDDILDVVSTDDELGKPVNSDEKNNKTTYVTLLGIDKAKEQVKEYTDRAINRLKGLNGNNEFLFELIERLISRRK